MAIKLKKLLLHDNVWNDVYATVKPTLVLKELVVVKADPDNDIEASETKVFKQKYNVEIKSNEGPFNYEAQCDLDTEAPTHAQCYAHLKSQPEFKNATDV
jgi:hypothetical protein